MLSYWWQVDEIQKKRQTLPARGAAPRPAAVALGAGTVPKRLPWKGWKALMKQRAADARAALAAGTTSEKP